MIRIPGSIDQFIMDDKIRLSKTNRKVKPIAPSTSISSSLNNNEQKQTDSYYPSQESFEQELKVAENRLLRK